MATHQTSFDRGLRRLALEELERSYGPAIPFLIQQVEALIVSFDSLSSQVQSAAGDETALKSAVSQALADIQSEIDGLRAQIPDQAVVDGLTQRVSDLRSALQADTSQVAAADPGAPAQPSPSPAPAPTPAPDPGPAPDPNPAPAPDPGPATP